MNFLRCLPLIFLFLFASPSIAQTPSVCDGLPLPNEEMDLLAKVEAIRVYYAAVDEAAADREFETAHTILECAMTAFPEGVYHYMKRAEIRFLEGDFEGALADIEFSKPLFTDPTSTVVIILRETEVLVAMQDYDRLIALLTDVRESRLTFLSDFEAALHLAYRERGILRVNAGEIQAGLEDLQAAYPTIDGDELLTDDLPGLAALGRALESTGDYGAAVQIYVTYISLAGDSADPEIIDRVTAFEKGGLAALMPEAPVMLAEVDLGPPTFRFVPFFFSSDSRVMGLADSLYVRLYDTETGEALEVIGTTDFYRGIAALNADGSLVAVRTGERNIEVIDTATAAVIFSTRMTQEYEPPHALAFNGDDLLVLDRVGILRRLDLVTGEFESELSLPIRLVRIGGADVFFVPEQNTLATYIDIISRRLLDSYDLRSGEVVKSLNLDEGRVVAMSDDLGLLAIKQSDEDVVRVMAFTPNGLSEITTLETPQITGAGDISTSGDQYLYGDANGQLILIDLTTSERSIVGVYDNAIRFAGLSPDGQLAVAIDTEGVLRWWGISPS